MNFDERTPLAMSSSEWKNDPYQLWSLWAMIQTYAWNLVNHIETLTSLRNNLEARLNRDRGIHDADRLLGDADIENFQGMFRVMRVWMEFHDLSASLDRMDRISELLVDAEASTPDLITNLRVLTQTLEDELKRRFFLYVPPVDAALYRNPMSFFPKAQTAFPSIGNDARDACRCRALGQSTASVFHSMGILQRGLYALAADLEVAFQFPLVLAEWHNIINQIESKIATLRSLPKGQVKDDLLTFYSQAAVQFRYFKDAWRNHVAHLRQEYDRDQAHSILLHIRDFMEHLASRLKEVEVPPLNVTD